MTQTELIRKMLADGREAEAFRRIDCLERLAIEFQKSAVLLGQVPFLAADHIAYELDPAWDWEAEAQ